VDHFIVRDLSLEALGLPPLDVILLSASELLRNLWLASLLVNLALQKVLY